MQAELQSCNKASTYSIFISMSNKIILAFCRYTWNIVESGVKHHNPVNRYRISVLEMTKNMIRVSFSRTISWVIVGLLVKKELLSLAEHLS